MFLLRWKGREKISVSSGGVRVIDELTTMHGEKEKRTVRQKMDANSKGEGDAQKWRYVAESLKILL